MILLVTNNDFTRAAFETALAKSSWDLVIKSVDDAPKYLSTRMPEMILIPAHSAHVRGFEFRTQYREEHTDRSTPFLFLVHRDGPDNVFDDIQFGEDDFICQPILDGYLNAKIRAVLERFESCSLPVFDGQISDFPFARILQFCERTGLTGEVSIQSGDSKKVLHFANGQLDLENNENEDAILEELFDLENGEFRVASFPVALSALKPSPKTEKRTEEFRKKQESGPGGRISGVRAGDKLFQLQTEFRKKPELSIVTEVIYGGRTISKKSNPPVSTDFAEIDKQIQAQHSATEEEVRQKLAAHTKKAEEKAAQDSLPDAIDEIIDMALNKFLDKDYETALLLWNKASTIDPNNKTVKINRRVVRKKLGLETD